MLKPIPGIPIATSWDMLWPELLIFSLPYLIVYTFCATCSISGSHHKAMRLRNKAHPPALRVSSVGSNSAKRHLKTSQEWQSPRPKEWSSRRQSGSFQTAPSPRRPAIAWAMRYPRGSTMFRAMEVASGNVTFPFSDRGHPFLMSTRRGGRSGSGGCMRMGERN